MTAATIHNETELLRLLHGGDRQAFTDLYHFYSGPMYVNVLKMVKDEETAHEIVQELFTRVWQKRELIQIEKNFAGYLYRIGQNLVHDFYNNLKKDQKLLDHFKNIVTENYTHIEEDMHYRENAALLEKAISSLPPQQQKAYRLVKLEGLSYRQAAETMGISQFTVKEYIARSGKALRDYLGNNPDTAIILIISLIVSC